METVIYNTITEKVVKRFSNGYFVDGVKPKLPNGFVELEVVKAPKPEYDRYLYNISHTITVDLENKVITNEWVLEEKSQAELDEIQAIENQRAINQQASNFIANLDVENINQSQLIKAVKALVILNR